MTLDTLIETGKILSYSESIGYLADADELTTSLSQSYSTMVLFMQDGKRQVKTFEATTRKDVTQQVIKYFS